MQYQSPDTRSKLGARTRYHHTTFVTPERFADEQAERMESTRGRLFLASCRAGSPLAGKVAERYQELIVTNSIPQTQAFRDLPFVSVRCLSERLAWAINRIHYQRPMSGPLDREAAGRS